MSFTGYRIYRGVGSLSSVDWTTPVATAAAGSSSVQMAGLGHTPGATYTYAVRPVRGDLETADVSCVVRVAFNGAGLWRGLLPDPVRQLTATAGAAGTVTVRWHVPGASDTVPAPDDFAMYYGPTSRVDTSGTPDVIVNASGAGDYAGELTLAHGQTVFIAVLARAGGVNSLARTVGPIVADAVATPAPAAYVDAAF